MSLPSGGLDRLRRLADEAAPREVCGLLLGQPDRVSEIIEIPNVAEGATEFVMDPDALFAVVSVREDIVGSWHSHPSSGAELSQADRAGSPRGWYQVVVGIDGVLAYRPTDDGWSRPMPVEERR